VALQPELITEIWPWRVRVEQVFAGPLQPGQQVLVTTGSMTGCLGDVDRENLAPGVEVVVFGRLTAGPTGAPLVDVCADPRYYFRAEPPTSPPQPPPSGAPVQALLTVDRGCGATYAVGDPIVVTVQIVEMAPLAARFQLLDVLPNGVTQVLFDQMLGEGTYTLNGTITPPTGLETLILRVFTSDRWWEVTRCSFWVVTGPGPGSGTGQVLLTIRAQTPQGEVPAQLGLTLNPPPQCPCAVAPITTPYQQRLPQGTRIRLEAPPTLNGYTFAYWQVFTRQIPGGPWILVGTFAQNPLVATLVSPEVLIIAVYR